MSIRFEGIPRRTMPTNESTAYGSKTRSHKRERELYRQYRKLHG
jgi:hypothetical protein